MSGATRPLSEVEKKERIERVWRLESVEEVPFLVEIGGFHPATRSYFDDHAAELAWNREYHRSRAAIYDYGMPNAKPNQGIGIVAAAFGCSYTVNDEADPWITPLIREDCLDRVHDLQAPDLGSNPVYGKARERVDFLESHGELPLRMLNVPSPLVTASLIWEYSSFLEATLVHPAEVHLLLEKVTQATIEYLRAQMLWIRRLHTRGHEMWYLPAEVGVRLSDDTAALMSPNLYREFGVRYNSMISRAFGGVVVHSCGDLQNVVGTMMETEGIRGIDLTIPQNSNWEVIRDAVCGKAALNLRYLHWDHAGGARVDQAEYTEKLVEYFGRRGIFLQTGMAAAEDAVALGEKLHRILS